MNKGIGKATVTVMATEGGVDLSPITKKSECGNPYSAFFVSRFLQRERLFEKHLCVFLFEKLAVAYILFIHQKRGRWLSA